MNHPNPLESITRLRVLPSLAAVLVACSATTPSGESSGETQGETQSETDTETGGASPEEHGAELYAKYCALCHGDEGQGYAADNANALANQEFLRLASPEFLASSIRYGRPGTPMSAWGPEKAGPFSDQDIEDLVAFIKTWQLVEDAEVDDYMIAGDSSLQRGESYYGEYGCQACHGLQGVGGEYMSLANPWFLTQISDGYLHQSLVHGRPDTPMDSYVDGDPNDLTPAQIDDIIMLIRSWEREPNSEPLDPFEPDVSNAVINPDGPDPGFEPVDGRFIGVDAVKAALDMGAKMILLDARPHADYVDGHIEGAVSVPFFSLELVIDQLPLDVWIVNYCGCPHAISGEAFDALAAAGFTNIAVLDEGYYEWVVRGYPIVEGE